MRLEKNVQPTLDSLTGARFFAAVAVVIGHYIQRFGTVDSLAPTANLAPASVAFFYMLSGFVLTYNYADKLIRWPSFMWARIARIYPTYFLGLLLGTVALVLEGSKIGTVVWPVNALALQDYVPLPRFHAINSPAWSISCEFFFYAAFPALLIVVKMFSPIRAAIAAFFLEGLLFALGVTVVLYVVAHGFWHLPISTAADLGVYRVPFFRLGEFTVGIALAFIWRRGPKDWNAIRCDAFLLFGIGFLWSVIWLFPVKASFSSPGRALLFFWVFIPVFAGMVIAMASGRGLLSRLLALPLVVLLGESSFALYILHEPVLRILSVYHVWPIVSFAFTLGVSILCFLFYEKPCRRFLRSVSVARPIRWSSGPALLPRP